LHFYWKKCELNVAVIQCKEFNFIRSLQEFNFIRLRFIWLKSCLILSMKMITFLRMPEMLNKCVLRAVLVSFCFCEFECDNNGNYNNLEQCHNYFYTYECFCEKSFLWQFPLNLWRLKWLKMGLLILAQSLQLKNVFYQWEHFVSVCIKVSSSDNVILT